MELYVLKGDRSKLYQAHVQKNETILMRLADSKALQAINQLGYKFHPLSGDLQDFYLLKFSGNYQIILQFEGKSVHDVDYVDYH